MSVRDTAGVIAPPPLIALGAIVCAAALEQAAPLQLLAGAPAPARWLIGGAMIAVAVLIVAAAIIGFQRAGTAVQTRSPSTALVTSGIYGLVRNPIYVGFFLILVGIAAVAAWDWLVLFAFVFVAIVHWGVVRREERYLAGKFGESYAAYKARVRRYGLF